ncbi:VOC family protein [Dickeya lacustris]|uniref:VOC family protein n=1 Tax=Dickeya lacustris TaxID=2259638 RepID=A0ABY8GBX4_9GAMM|nr:VOC family protein [Dickeya lacustris]WFN57473.1 VOC family protein [Dickeya lacustris]
MLSGFNHLTLSVRDLSRSLAFYQQLLGFELQAHWENGAYLSLPGLWLCLSQESMRGEISAGYTHYALSIDAGAFAPFCQRLREAGVTQWKDNRSEGESFYFLDPDGHQLEIHVGDLASRLDACRSNPYAEMKIHQRDQKDNF